MNALTYALPGYLLGSLPFAVIVSKIFGLDDPRSFGSKNPGATNVLRSGHKLAAALTLLGDATKGWLAMWLTSLSGADATGVAGAGLGAFLGHIFPVFLKFRGGKGVATALGVLAGFSGWLALIAAATWASVAAIFRYSSLAALAAAAVAPFVAWAIVGAENAVVVGIICAMLFWRHKDNIKRLAAGTESRIGRKKSASGAA